MGDPKNSSDSLFFLHQEITRLFSDVFADEEATKQLDSPAVDVLETNDSLKIEIEVPGLEKKDITLQISGDLLIVEGLKRDTDKTEGAKYVCMERRFGFFRRTLPLPAMADSSNIRASHENGVLTITLPKIADRRGTVRRIGIE